MRSIVILLLVVLVLPLGAYADIVPWSSESYTAIAERYSSSEQDSASGPPFPVTAEVQYSSLYLNEHAYSNISASSMYVKAMGGGQWGGSSMASGEFLGTYTATDAYFIFSYSYIYTNWYDPYDYHPIDGYIAITDNTTSQILFSQSYFDSDETLWIPTITGNEIQVNFYLESQGHPGPLFAEGGTGGTEQTLNFNMSVGFAIVPEPISSILFISGGALLAGRRYLKRKNRT